MRDNKWEKLEGDYWNFVTNSYRIKPYRLEPKGAAYSLNAEGKVGKFLPINEDVMSYGNSFNSKQEAEAASKSYRLYHRMDKLAAEYGDEVDIAVGNNSAVFTFYFRSDTMEIVKKEIL